ncbi:MAG: thioredoxin [Muribaculaceae bacterium]|nr:thioredoxin [Muribaculaceae bacterium]MBR5532192.1 thioredoxin [Bacteroidales bacterium]
MALEVTDGNYQELLSSDKLVVVDLWAEWCGSCKGMLPTIEELATEYEGKAIIGKCDTEENYDLIDNYKVRSLPTILFFKGGELVDKIVGSASKVELKDKIEANL